MHHPTQCARHKRTIKRLKEAKQRAKKTLRAARKANLEQNAIFELSQDFHQALREYSKAVKHQRRSQDARNSNKATKRCAKDFWCFAHAGDLGRKGLILIQHSPQLRHMISLLKHNIIAILTLTCFTNPAG